MLDAAQVAVLEFVGDIVRTFVPALRRWREWLAFWPPPLLTDPILLIGQYMRVAGFPETTEVDVDSQPVDWNAFTSATG